MTGAQVIGPSSAAVTGASVGSQTGSTATGLESALLWLPLSQAAT